jgi:hypothetical protein
LGRRDAEPVVRAADWWDRKHHTWAATRFAARFPAATV